MDNETHVLLVDDEMSFSEMTKEYLEAKNFQVCLVHNAIEGLSKFKNGRFDICILDVKMPIKDGFSLATDIRTLDQHIPIIFLSGQTQKESRIKGLTIGADDYITKPFSMEELFLRVKAILKRVNQQEAKTDFHTFEIREFTFSPISRELEKKGRVQKLSAIEANLLHLFCEHLNDLVSRDLALTKIWGDDHYSKGRSLNVYVSKLRSYFKKDSKIEFLNVHGAGYRMVVKD